MQHPTLMDIVRKDPRYPYEAYVFVFEALAHTQKRLGRGVALDGESAGKPERHVSGPELIDGACDLARQEFGLMANAVFHVWNIRKTDDFGEIVFNLIEANLLSKTDKDCREDFQSVFDLNRALSDGYQIDLAGLARRKQK